MLIAVKGQIIIAVKVMHIVTNDDILSTEMLGEQTLSRDMRQCDTFDWEADEVRKAVHILRVYA